MEYVFPSSYKHIHEYTCERSYVDSLCAKPQTHSFPSVFLSTGRVVCVDVYPKHSALFLVNFRCHNCEKRHKAAAQRPTANSLLNCECDEIAWLPRTAHTNTLSSKCHSVCAIRRDNSSVPFIFVWMHSNAMWINESQINCENARMLLQKRRVLEMLFKRDQIDQCIRWTTYGLLANGRPPFSVHTFYENANSHFFLCRSSSSFAPICCLLSMWARRWLSIIIPSTSSQLWAIEKGQKPAAIKKYFRSKVLIACFFFYFVSQFNVRRCWLPCA